MHLLLITLLLNVFHDLLPYHNHHNAHINHEMHRNYCEKEEHSHSKDQDFHDYTLCNICFSEQINVFNQFQCKVTFSAGPTDIILLDQDIVRLKFCNSIENNTFTIPRSNFKKRSHAHRAPPFIG
ncbi:MAG: hypothetical protein JXQ65_10815 [Candidatus Marinimicrobia bacterium]|nr:hypothetical protein [Candidatus Neomarinimicrobiota bacterium]